MGSDFDARWMSIDPPTAGAADLVKVSVTENQVAELVEQVSELNLEKELEDMAHGNDLAASASGREAASEVNEVRHEMIAVFKQWLVRKSSCPVAFSWHDLGEYFWPRWVVRGECQAVEEAGIMPPAEMAREGGNGGKGCSWPLGMKCVPGRAETLHILRWHCRRRKTFRYAESSSDDNDGAKHKCRWYKVPYPVTTTCKCACQ